VVRKQISRVRLDSTVHISVWCITNLLFYTRCACDIPVHNYQFAWAPNPYFKNYYASSEEIRQYLDDVTDQHDLRKYLKLSHKVVGAKWIEERSTWQVAVQKVETTGPVTSKAGEETLETFIDECDIFISGTGYVNDWKWPAIAGRETFKGEMLHSAIWPKDHTFKKDQRVALIGNGSTGIQILPAILDQVKKVYVFIRSPTWITAGFAQKYAGPDGANVTFTEEQKQRWADNPEEYYAYRVAVEAELNNRFRIYLKDSDEQSEAKSFSIRQMSDKLARRPDLLKLLLPDFAVG
jgi:cation diffusion facilitator CzcD-associated flavoprotein CzcO